MGVMLAIVPTSRGKTGGVGAIATLAWGLASRRRGTSDGGKHASRQAAEPPDDDYGYDDGDDGDDGDDDDDDDDDDGGRRASGPGDVPPRLSSYPPQHATVAHSPLGQSCPGAQPRCPRSSGHAHRSRSGAVKPPVRAHFI